MNPVNKIGGAQTKCIPKKDRHSGGIKGKKAELMKWIFGLKPSRHIKWITAKQRDLARGKPGHTAYARPVSGLHNTKKKRKASAAGSPASTRPSPARGRRCRSVYLIGTLARANRWCESARGAARSDRASVGRPVDAPAMAGDGCGPRRGHRTQSRVATSPAAGRSASSVGGAMAIMLALSRVARRHVLDIA